MGREKINDSANGPPRRTRSGIRPWAFALLMLPASRPDGRKIASRLMRATLDFKCVAGWQFRGEFWQADAQRLVARTSWCQRARG
jgi:hypothetical protein